MPAPQNKVVRGANAIDYAFREVGNGTVPLVLLQHFRGNLENWDPAFVDELGAQRRVVAFDNVGVRATTGVTRDTIDQMARDAVAFIAALDVKVGPVAAVGVSGKTRWPTSKFCTSGPESVNDAHNFDTDPRRKARGSPRSSARADTAGSDGLTGLSTTRTRISSWPGSGNGRSATSRTSLGSPW